MIGYSINPKITLEFLSNLLIHSIIEIPSRNMVEEKRFYYKN